MRIYMNIKKMLAVAFSLVWSLPAWSAVNSGNISIDRVEVTDAFFTIYSASGPVVNDNCEDSGKVVFWRADYPNGYDSLLSVALSAHMSDKKISMWLDGCKSGPWGKTLPKAGSIVVLKN